MAIDLAALKNELTNDPTALGYAPFIASSIAEGDGKGNDGAAAQLLNKPIVGPPSFFRSDVTIHDIVGAIAPADFASLTALQIAKLQLLFAGVSTIDLTVAPVRTILQAIFAGASAPTLTALSNMAKRTGSRAETLFGPGAIINHNHVALALRG